MAQDTTVIEHLMQGRQALEREVARLNEAMAQLDAVIALFESGASSSALSSTSPLVRSSTNGATSATVTASTEPRAPRRPAKKATRTKRESSDDSSDAPKSIREHVLDMLGSQNRDFGLAEIIDRIHGLGIQAHDDAVRSITIKLMKDGQVERVGRGQYRLAGGTRTTSDATTTDPVATAGPASDDSNAPHDPAASTETASTETASTETASTETESAETESAETVESTPAETVGNDTVETVESGEPADATVSDDASHGNDAVPQDATADEVAPDEQPEQRSSSSYTPPLNLGQPWN